MKILHLKSMFVALISLSTLATTAQQNEGSFKMYENKPTQINVETNTLASTVNFAKGNQVNITLSSDLHFTGTVIFKENTQTNLQTIAIKSADINNAILHLNKITNADNSITYTGRIMNPLAADGYLLKNNNGIYSLQKFDSATLLEPCKL